jgi:hypothetical protein
MKGVSSVSLELPKAHTRHLPDEPQHVPRAGAVSFGHSQMRSEASATIENRCNARKREKVHRRGPTSGGQPIR